MNPMPTLDQQAIRSDLRQLAEDLRLCKRALRRPGHDITREEAADLSRRKARCTLLCALRAHARGRVHLHGATWDEQGRWLAERFPSSGCQGYALAPAA